MKPSAIFLFVSMIVMSSWAFYLQQPDSKSIVWISPARSQPVLDALESDKQAALQALLTYLEPHYCDVEAGGQFSEPPKESVWIERQKGKQIYWVWWYASAVREGIERGNGQTEIICNGGSGTSSFYLAKLVKRGNRFVVLESDVLHTINAVNHPEGWGDTESPHAIHSRFIHEIQLQANHTLMIIADKHAPEAENEWSATNFPTRRWQYRGRLSDLKLLSAQFIGKIVYQDDGTVMIEPQ